MLRTSWYKWSGQNNNLQNAYARHDHFAGGDLHQRYELFRWTNYGKPSRWLLVNRRCANHNSIDLFPSTRTYSDIVPKLMRSTATWPLTRYWNTWLGLEEHPGTSCVLLWRNGWKKWIWCVTRMWKLSIIRAAPSENWTPPSLWYVKSATA